MFASKSDCEWYNCSTEDPKDVDDDDYPGRQPKKTSKV